jgi:excisionase family DNA binding protein
MDKFFNVEELSQFLRVKKSTVYDWTHKGLIPFYKIHKLVRFRESEINEWLKTKRQKTGKINVFLQ